MVPIELLFHWGTMSKWLRISVGREKGDVKKDEVRPFGDLRRTLWLIMVCQGILLILLCYYVLENTKIDIAMGLRMGFRRGLEKIPSGKLTVCD